MKKMLQRGMFAGILVLAGTLSGCISGCTKTGEQVPERVFEEQIRETVRETAETERYETVPPYSGLPETEADLPQIPPEENRQWSGYVSVQEWVTEDPDWASYMAGDDRFAPFAPDTVWKGYMLTTEQPEGWRDMEKPDGTTDWIPSFHLYHVPEGGADFTEELARTIAGSAHDAYLLGNVLCEVQKDPGAAQMRYYFYIPLTGSLVFRMDMGAESLTMAEQYTLVENLSLTPTEYREVQNEYGIITRTEDGGLRIEPVSGEPVTLSFPENSSVQWPKEDTVQVTLYEGGSRYQMLVSPATGEKQHCRQETGALLRQMGLTAEEVLSMRYAASFYEGTAEVTVHAVTREAHICRSFADGEETFFSRTPLLQKEKPDPADLPELFRTMLRYVNYSLALNEISQQTTLSHGNSMYYLNEQYGILTPAALEYVFSCFLTRGDTVRLMEAENYKGQRWWQKDEKGYLYISPVSFALDGLYGEEPVVTESPDGNFDVTVGDRAFRYVQEDGRWCWQLTPDAESHPGEEPVPGTVPAELTEQAALLTDQLVTRVMSPDWLTEGYAFTAQDLHWFLMTMDLYMDMPLYPWCGEMTERREGSQEYRCFSGDTARRAVRELFGTEDAGFRLPVAEDIYDSRTDTYRIHTGAGRNTTVFWYENMETTVSGDLVWVDTDLVSARWYEWEELYYGRYRFVYRAVTEDGRTFLRLTGVEKQYAGYRAEAEDFYPPEKYLNVLIDYFSTPYVQGDPLEDHNILYLCAVMCSSETPPSLPGMTHENGILTIPRQEAEALALRLLGTPVDLTMYHPAFAGTADRYDEEQDAYIFRTGRDYWNGDEHHYSDMVMRKEGDMLTVEITIKNTGYMTDSSVEPVEKRMAYHFRQIVREGIQYPQLTEVEWIPTVNDPPAVHWTKLEPAEKAEAADAPAITAEQWASLETLAERYLLTLDGMSLLLEKPEGQYTYTVKAVYAGDRAYPLPPETILVHDWLVHKTAGTLHAAGMTSPSDWWEGLPGWWLVVSPEGIWFTTWEPEQENLTLSLYAEDGVLRYHLGNLAYSIQSMDELVTAYRCPEQFYGAYGVVDPSGAVESDAGILREEYSMSAEEWFHSEQFLSREMRALRDREQVGSLQEFVEIITE